jgi:ubiquinone/menaquinone biosynthesis C-methylase UbiE
MSSASTPIVAAASGGSDWNSYGNEYQKLMTKIPFHFSKHAQRLLFAESDFQEPVKLIDIAAGPGVFLHILFEHLLGHRQSFEPGSELLVTDVAESMLTAARQSLLSSYFSSEQLRQLGLSITEGDPLVESQNSCKLTFQVVNATQLQDDVPLCSFSHLVCMFGIMFFGDPENRKRALQGMQRVLLPGRGKAVIGTWQTVAITGLCHDFGLFLDPQAVEHRPPASASPLEIGKDPAVLREELLAAGFAEVQVHESHETFVISSHDDGFFHALFTNPPVVKMYPELAKGGMPPNWLQERWSAFMELQKQHLSQHDGVDCQELSPSWKLKIDPQTQETSILLPYRANLAIAHA